MRKNLMVLLAIIFVLSLILLFVFFSKRAKPMSVSLPLPKPSPTPTVIFLPTPTVVPQLQEIDNDLKMINLDIEKVKEDLRLNPPVFSFEIEIKE